MNDVSELLNLLKGSKERATFLQQQNDKLTADNAALEADNQALRNEMEALIKYIYEYANKLEAGK